MKRYIWLVVILLLLWIPITTAQSTPLLAFLNGSGQLVVSSGDGATRWIVTNPGQQVDTSLGFAWTADGNLVFALAGMGVFEGDPATQNITQADTSDPATLAYLRGLGNRPNSAYPQGLSSDGQFAFVANGTNYAIADLTNNNILPLPLAGDSNEQKSGLWADNTPLVAYWGLDNNGGTVLSVVDATSLNSVTLQSGRSVPMFPIAWLPDTEFLFFRSPTGDVMLADVSCLAAGCSGNPLENGVMVAPSSANQLQVTASHLYYVDGEQLMGVDITCVNSNNCLDSVQVLGDKVVPLTMMHVRNDRLVYTAYANNPNTDRIAMFLDLTCVPDCQPQPIVNNAMAGLLSPDGDYLVIDSLDAGLNILDISGGGLVYLTDTMGGQLGAGLLTTRWR